MLINNQRGLSSGAVTIACAICIALLVGIRYADEKVNGPKNVDGSPKVEVGSSHESTPTAEIPPVLELKSWNWRTKHSYAIAEGLVTNLTSEPIDNVQAVVTFFDKDGTFISSSNALIEYRPLLPGQSSPFEVLKSWNPAMHSATVEFKTFGGNILLYRIAKPIEPQQTEPRAKRRK